MGIQIILMMISVFGNFSIIDACTARAPTLAHPGHDGESKAKNRILRLWSLNLSFKGISEFSSEINSKRSFDSIRQPFFWVKPIHTQRIVETV
jgi:hypothetical protein